MRSAREDARRLGFFRFAIAGHAFLRSWMLRVKVSYALRADTLLVGSICDARAGHAFLRARMLKV